MGNLCSTPSTTCCKRPCPFPALRHHARGCKRIKYSLVPQRDPDRQRRKNSALANNYRNGGSPNTLHRSNAVRRPGNSSSQSSSPHPPRPSRLEIRNATPPPFRPSSIVPTLMLVGTPSTDPPTSKSRSSRTNATHTTSPTSPTTIISSPYNYSTSSGSAGRRPRTLYMVDGEVVGSDEEHLELRWIDALRAPGAPGGYRTVVDVVEERRSGRLTVVNGGGRGSEDSVRLGPYTFNRGISGGDRVDGIYAPRDGRATHRNALEEEDRARARYRRQLQQYTPVRRKPVPRRVLEISDQDQSPLASRSNAAMNAISGSQGGVGADADEDSLSRKFRWRRAPMSRPPIPTFRSVGATEKELLDEVEDARLILERKGLMEDEEDEMDKGEGMHRDAEDVLEEVEREEEDDHDKEDENAEKDEGENEPMDFFWADDEGKLRYKRCSLPI
ncbi:MAG: hypothetical protein Q9226_006376 [Calogaya cf. arnoldii]